MTPDISSMGFVLINVQTYRQCGTTRVNLALTNAWGIIFGTKRHLNVFIAKMGTTSTKPRTYVEPVPQTVPPVETSIPALPA